MKKYILPFINKGTQHIIKADAEKEIISLALVSKWGFIFYGPGGHAKSVLTESVKDMIVGVNWNIKSMGSGTREDELKGGIDLNALEGITADGIPTAKRIKYNYQYSPLNADILGLEEGFDMPDTIGANFKDWITSKRFRDGNEEFALPLCLVYVTTNKEPQEVASKGDWVEALIQRFPLQHRSAWDKYDAQAYIDLFNAPAPQEELIEWQDILDMQNRAKRMVVGSGIKKILAEMFGKVAEKGTPISPRTANIALQIIQSAAVISGDKQVEREHLSVIKYLPGMADLGKGIEGEIEAAHSRSVAQVKFDLLLSRANKLFSELYEATSPIKALQIGQHLKNLNDELASLSVTDNLVSSRNELRNSIAEKNQQAIEKAVNLTRI
jgi:hypothetical protein